MHAWGRKNTWVGVQGRKVNPLRTMNRKRLRRYPSRERKMYHPHKMNPLRICLSQFLTIIRVRYFGVVQAERNYNLNMDIANILAYIVARVLFIKLVSNGHTR